MSSNLGSVIQLGKDITADKYHAIAVGAIFFYDYLLTLPDEVKYVWSGRRSWAFWIFIFNRYFPMTWQFWQLTVTFAPPSRFTTEVGLICSKNSFYGLFMLVVCTLIAQTVLTARIYAVTMKNIPIAFGFTAITVTQCALGIYLTIHTASKGVQPLPPIPLDAYHLCVFAQINRGVEVTYTSLSLFYDVLAFLVVVLQAKKSRVRGLNVSTILDTIAVDATYYFMVIFTSHFVLVMTLNLGRVTIQLLPGPGVLV
ncbi:hypothetical protein BJ322DRAFT_1051375 [Thelephora terrestris]|uniref:DUF6533 domain-containing protein n=1 Tax=Thelephora terrestris TaxID=56493 RepID=A0A9P6HJH5_9AGAM|nr:hypothetical protein BJ322DRAFT_1051375 [Thelephora terrestris]